MIVRADEMVKAVRVAIDMNREDPALIADDDTDTLTLDELIKSKIEEAAIIIESRAPVYLLDSGKPLSGSLTFSKEIGIGRGRLQLPDDFLRLITFKMSDWERAVTTPIFENDRAYKLQSSRFAGLRGNPQKPVVAIVSEPTGLVLEFWSCTGGSTVTLQRGRYLPIPKITDGNIEICEKLKKAIEVYAGYLTTGTTGDRELADHLRAQASLLSETNL